MLSIIHNEIDYTDAILMDSLYDSCTSIKKLIDTINYSLAEFSPNLQLYFLITTFDILFNNGSDNTKTIERILKTLDIKNLDLNVLVTIIQVLSYCPTQFISNYNNFYNTSKVIFDNNGIAIEELDD